jgi:ribosomal protein L11 methyltransferase
LIKPGGIYIASGIISDRLDDVLNALEQNGFLHLRTELMDDWAAVLSEKL